MIIDLCKIDMATPKGCHAFPRRIMPSLRDLNFLWHHSTILSSLRDCKLHKVSYELYNPQNARGRFGAGGCN